MANSKRNQLHFAEWFSHGFTVASILIALPIFILAPIWALSWQKLPFPGFVIEQTGVVSNTGSNQWSGRSAGLSFPQRLRLLNGIPIESPTDFKSVLAPLTIGQIISVRVELPDGTTHDYPSLLVTRYRAGDMARHFWLPYLTGLAYLAIAIVIYALRRHVIASRSLALFCAWAAVVFGLSFDLTTTHLGSALWTMAIAMLGGAIAGLAFLFPDEVSPASHRARLRLVGYGVSAALTIWGWVVLTDTSNPWAYVLPWRLSYEFAALSLLFLFGMLGYRLRTDLAPVVRQQIRLLLFGSLVAFVWVGLWFAAPMVNLSIPWDPAFFAPLTLIFPVSVLIAILRYRMWEIAIILRRTFVYSVLTGILGAIYITSVILLQQLFIILTGGVSPIATVISTLTIAILFVPLRRWVQKVIDRRFYRSRYDAEKTLAAFSVAARDEVDLERLRAAVLGVVRETMQPEQVSLWLKEEHRSVGFEMPDGLSKGNHAVKSGS